VDFRFNAFSCFEASKAMQKQKQADAFRGAGGEPPQANRMLVTKALPHEVAILAFVHLSNLRGLTCPADPAGKILDELSFVQYLCDE
jgi:hypothetical protein